MNDFDKNIASRRVGRRVQNAGGTTTLVTFGPFRDGEKLEGLFIYLTNAAPSAGDTIQIDIAVFNSEPTDSTSFSANGRLLTVGGPRLPVVISGVALGFGGYVNFYLSVGFVADWYERFLSVLLTESAGDATDGSIWAVVS